MNSIASSSDVLPNSHIRSLQNNTEKSQIKENVELRSRSKQPECRNEDYSVNNYPNRIIIDHKVKDGETLNSIAIQYSVQVFLKIVFIKK